MAAHLAPSALQFNLTAVTFRRRYDYRLAACEIEVAPAWLDARHADQSRGHPSTT
jgi:hypothetical protein